jgi:SAM-dependent methyltransferase
LKEPTRWSPANVGLKDLLLDGWVNQSTGELVPGVTVDASSTVIDVGCGDGGFTGFCAKQGAEVIFIDHDEVKLVDTQERVKRAATGAYQAIVSDCAPIPLNDGVGDIVVCTEVLEHVPDPLIFLKEMVRVAKRGARLVITVPDARSETFVAATAPESYFQEPNHIRIFYADEFRDLILQAGLTIEDHQFRGCFWSMYMPLTWLTTTEPDAGLPLDNPDPITVHWTKLWQLVQQHPDGAKIRNALNSLLPKSQCIVARKV